MSSSSPSTVVKRERVPATDEHEATKPAQPPPRSPEHERLHVSFRDDKHYLQQMVALDRNKRSDRVDAILSLKGSIEMTATEIQSRNARQNRKAHDIEEEDARRFQELLNQGKNPYEVARTRTVRETADKERKKIEHRIQEKQVSILKHLEVEKVWMQRQERVKQEQQAYEKKYQQEMGRAAVEARTKDYLVSRMGKETMDPTGKAFRLYPSQETTIKDRSFGLGKNLVHDAEQRHKIVDKIHRKRAHRDAPGAAPASMLLPRVADETSNNAAERGHSPSVSMLSATATPDQELQDLNHSVVERDAGTSKMALPPLGARSTSTGSDSPSNQTQKKEGFGKPHRSVLEQRMLEQARERQKTNIFQKQVVWGKEFTGRAFLADPAEIWFKDFDVGVPMTLHITLTNVSNSFNHFKLLDLDESIKECFEIQFEKPGRMSAGMACRISITFTASEARDIDSLVPAIAQTGPFSIPLLCTCKKAVPVLETRALAFKDVVAGEKQVLTLKLENQGALPLEFRVRRLKANTTSSTAGSEQDDEGDGGDDGLGNAEEAGRADEERRQEELLMEGNINPSTEGMQASVETPHENVSGDHPEEVDGTEHGDRPMGDDEAEDVEEKTLSRDPSSQESLASSSSTASLQLALSRVPHSHDEQRLLEIAKLATVYRPEGADKPIRHTFKGTVAPYASIAIAFTFAPAAPMEIEDETFVVEFPEAATTHRKAFWSQKLLAAIPVTISAHASHVPIFVEQPVLDFRCCLYDRLYRNQLTVCNRGSIALKMQIRVPKALEDCLEFNPNMGFVQGSTAKDSDAQAGKFFVQIKFRPHAGMWKRLEAKSFGSASLGFLAVPIQVIVPDQVIPVYFILMARTSPAALTFSHKRLDFGPCVLGHSVAHVLQITNTSRLPQRLAFVKLPSDIRLEHPESTANAADDGVATLLPQEIRHFRVVYQPNASATTLSSRLVCRTTATDEYAVGLAGECLASPLVFSHSVLHLGATQLGQKTAHSITCTNNSEKPQTLELVVPPGAETVLRVTPTVATIAPRSSVRIEVEFTAHDDIYELSASEYSVVDDCNSTMAARSIAVNASRLDATAMAKQTRNALTGVASTPSWVRSGGVAPEERSIHHTWSVLCFRKQSDAKTVAFQVRTTVIDAKLFTTPKDLDFGQVAIGQTLVRELKFTNNSDVDVQLRAKALHALGGFRMINSVQRTIAGRGGERRLKMEFKPTAPLLYDDELEFYCPELGVIRVALSGEGVNPSLHIVPADGIVDFSDVLARNRESSELQLTNASAFPLTLSIVPLEEDEPHDASVTSAGLPPFTFSPSVATIPAQATLSVKVLFFPDHQRPQHYKQKYLIQVPNESERHIITLAGRCWENQLYVFNPNEPPKLFAAPAVEDLFDVPPSINLTNLLGSGAAASLFTSSLAVPGIKKAAAPLTVVFGGDSETPTAESKTIFIGGTLPPTTEDAGSQKAGAPVGTFEFAVEENPDKPQYAKMFALEPMKGAVSSAQQLPIQLTYQPPQAAAINGGDGSPEPRAHPELVVSQWIQVRVTCTLKGGVLWRPLPASGAAPAVSGAASGGKAAAPVPIGSGESDTRVVQLVLRAKMHT